MKHMKHLLLASCLSVLALTASANNEDMPDLFSTLVERESIPDSTNLGIDPSKLFLSQDAVVDVYFLGEGAGYRNSFGWYDAKEDPTIPENRNVIWRNASKKGSGGNLEMGDSVSLGELPAGTELGFYLTANGYSNPDNPTYYTEGNYNPDGIEHVVAGATGDDGLLALGIEDLWGGGDQDYNDLMIAIDIGVENIVQVVAAAPEPEVWMLIFITLIVTSFQLRGRVV